MKPARTAPPRPPTPALRAKRRAIANAAGTPAQWALRLYVAGETPKSRAAFSHLEIICEENLGGRYRIEVIDLLKTPARAVHDQIVALPTLVRHRPVSMRRIVGDLSHHDRVLAGLELPPAKISVPQHRN